MTVKTVRETEEARATLGASRVRTLIHVVLPMLTPDAMAGVSRALARPIGEYGAVISIAANLPNLTESAPC